MEYKLIQYLTFLDIVAMVIMRTVELVIVVTVALKGKKSDKLNSTTIKLFSV